MKARKLLLLPAALLITVAVTVGIISINHPIILKWVSGSARHFGTPISAGVYTNGKLNEQARIFYTDKPNSYLLCPLQPDSQGKRHFYYIDAGEKSIRKSVALSHKDHDFIWGHLFQVNTPVYDSVFTKAVDQSGFDSQFLSVNQRLSFRLPPGSDGFDSVRVEFE